MDLSQLQSIVTAGESETVEWKRSTAQLPRAGETMYAFLNGVGGVVVIGVEPNCTIVGQEVADGTQQKIARILDRFEPPAPVETSILPVPDTSRSVVVLRILSEFRLAVVGGPRNTPPAVGDHGTQAACRIRTGHKT